MLNLEGAPPPPHFLDMLEKNTFTGKLTRKKIYVLYTLPLAPTMDKDFEVLLKGFGSVLRPLHLSKTMLHVRDMNE